jgi:hypothetical protein
MDVKGGIMKEYSVRFFPNQLGTEREIKMKADSILESNNGNIHFIRKTGVNNQKSVVEHIVSKGSFEFIKEVTDGE